jgi:hypothetical protein
MVADWVKKMKLVSSLTMICMSSIQIRGSNIKHIKILEENMEPFFYKLVMRKPFYVVIEISEAI